MTSKNLLDLVQPDRVHSRVYTDPEIFDLEIKHIFGKAWLFACHDSQIPNAGDFLTVTLALQPVLLTRNETGEVTALFNRCTHRGSQLVRETSGNSKLFHCPFHGWGFRVNGDLAGIPFRGAYSDEFMKRPELNLAKLPAVGNYRGFVFVRLSDTGVAFEDFIMQLKEGIDSLHDRAPGNALIADNGVHRYEYKGNWKLQIENGVDEYHPLFAHASTVGKDGKQIKRSQGNSGYKYTTNENERPETATRSYFDNSEVHGFPYGQSYLSFHDRNRVADMKEADYRRRLIERHGSEERVAQIEEQTHISNCIFYPNLIMRVTGNIHLRIVRPISVDRTEVMVYPLRFKGASDAMNADIMRYANVHASVSSFVQTDDLEIFERCQQGMRAQAPEWVWLARGFEQETPGSLPGETVALGTWETGMRAQFSYWKILMAEAGQ